MTSPERLAILLVGSLLAFCPVSRAQDAGLLRQQAAARIQELGGTVNFDRRNPGVPAAVLLGFTNIRDEDLAVIRLLNPPVWPCLRRALPSLDRGLQRLALGATPITDAALVHLKGQTTLRTLDLSRTKVADAGLENLKDLTNLQSLNLSGTPLTNAGLARIRNNTSIEELNLSGTPITDAGLEYLMRLERLQNLNLGGISITNQGLANIKGLLGLRQLNLGGTKITDAGIEHLRQLIKLEDLFVPWNISNQALSQLRGVVSEIDGSVAPIHVGRDLPPGTPTRPVIR